MTWLSDPDAHFSGMRIVACLGITVLFLAGVVGWGRVMCRVLRLERSFLLEEGLLGTGSLAVGGQLLGLAGIVGDSWRWLWLLPPAVGLISLVCGAWVSGSGKGWFRRRGRMSLVRWLWFAVIFVIATRFFRASLVLGGTDPAIYHLYSPRVWWDAGQIFLPSHAAAVYVSSYWESFLLWGCALFAGPGGSGLIEFNLFAQWAHVAVGVGGTTLALKRWFEPALGEDSPFFPIVVLSAVVSLPFKAESMAAMSDWAALFWLAGGAVLFLNKERSRLTDCLGGAILGVGLVTRMTSFFFLFGFVPAFLWRRPGWKRTLGIGASAAVVIAPILLRNYLATSNPTYPWLNSIFPSPLIGPTLSGVSELQAPAFSVATAELSDKLRIFATQTPLGAGLALWPLAAHLDPRLRELRTTVWATVLALGLGLFWPVGDLFHVRWFGLPLLLQGGLGAVAIAALIAKIFRKRAITSYAAVALGVLLVGFGAEWRGWDLLFSGPPAEARIRESKKLFLAGAAKAWLRKNADPSSLIVSTWDNTYYYLLPNRVSNLVGDAELDREAHGRAPEAVLAILRKHGARYLLDTLSWVTLGGSGMYYWGPYSELLAPLFMGNPESIVYWGDDLAVVVDLSELDERVFHRCLKSRE